MRTGPSSRGASRVARSTAEGLRLALPALHGKGRTLVVRHLRAVE